MRYFCFLFSDPEIRMNPRLVLMLLALVVMATSMTIRNDKEENHDDVVKQNADFSKLFASKNSKSDIALKKVNSFLKGVQ